MTELVSNSAVIALVMPVILPVADQVSMDPRVFAWAAPISAGLAFVLPTSTPALAMVFGTGHLRIRHAMPGLIITFFSLLAFLLAARFVWPLIGLPVTP
jgi:sodium-dependent dicarboxylate transporter 2/3/5